MARPVHQTDLRVGVVSVAPPTEVSGQGRVLSRLLAGSPCLAMSEFATPGEEDGVEIVKLNAAGGPVTTLLMERKYETSATYARIAETVLRRTREIQAAAASFRCSILVGCTGSPYDLTATALAARRLRVPFVAYLFDDAIGQWPEGPLRRAARWLRRIWLPRTDLLVAPNEFTAEAWRSGRLRCAVLRNPIAKEFDDISSRSAPGLPADGRPLHIVYTGSVYHAQADAFHNVLAALDELQGVFHLDVFTSQPAAWVETCGVRGPHVTRYDPVPETQIPGVLSGASVLLLPLGFNTGIPEAIRTASPGKLGEYLSAGRPMLAHVPADSFVAAFCREKDCALVVDTPDPGALAEALNVLRKGGSRVEQLVANARAASREFKIEAVRQEFWTLLAEVAVKA